MHLFSILATVISVYTLLCFVRVMLTWFPGAEYSKFGQILSQLCDPYLNLFRRFSFFRFSSFDFTPAIALCILMALQTMCSSFATGRSFQISTILAMLVMLVGNILISVLGFLALIFLIRLVVYLIVGDDQSSYSIWTVVDRTINPIIFRISGFFNGGRPSSFVRALITSLITVVVFLVLIFYTIRLLGSLISMIPF